MPVERVTTDWQRSGEPPLTPMTRLLVLASNSLVIAIAACSGADASRGAPAAGLATAFDSTGDTVVARVTGVVGDRTVRHLVEELRIAPAVDDTSLFTEIAEFDVDAAGRLWVYDQPTSRVFLFATDGTLLRAIGRKGAGPGEFYTNSGMLTLADTGLALWDPRNGRITFLTNAGDYRTSWITPTSFSTQNGLVGDRSGTLYLRRPVRAPREGEVIGRLGLVRLKDGGAFADSLAPPEVDVPSHVYVAVRTSGGGTSRSGASVSFAPRYLWAWHPDGWFVVGNGATYEITLHRTGAKPVVIRREVPRVSVDDDERAEEEARILFTMRQLDPGWRWQGPAIPQAKAPLRDLFVARDGRIWAQVATPSRRIPDAELPEQRENAIPIRHFRSPVEYEVFAPDGRFLGRVVFPPRTGLTEADGEFVWGVARDENDLPGVVRFRLDNALR